MNIAFVINNMGAGGAERVVTSISEKLVEKGHSVTIITIYEGESYYEMNPKIKIESCKDCSNHNKLFRFFNSIISLREKFKIIKPDIIISFLSIVNIYSILANMFLKSPIIVSERNDPNKSPNQYYYRFLRKITYIFADGFVFQTKDAQKYFNKKIQRNSVIIQNPVVLNLKNNEEFYTRDNSIVSVGRLNKQKNHKLLIDSFSKICGVFDEYNLIIYGEGPERRELENYIDQKKLKGKVTLPGTSKNLHDQIKNASLFVLSSNYEGMPNALMEAMALGIPCISTDCPIGGPGEIISHERNGILVPVGDSEKLAKSIAKVLSDKNFSKELRENSKEINQKNSIDHITKLWEEYLIKVLSVSIK